MNKIQSKRRISKKAGIITSVLAVCLIGAGLYVLSLISAPVIMPALNDPIDTNTLAEPEIGNNRVIIPKIGVNIPYDDNQEALNTGAWWRHADRGNPVDGGNFILAAHRFEIQPTPQATWEKSPFYHIEKMAIGDQIVIDYEGKRYGYEIDTVNTVKPTQIEVEAPSETAKLTLYSCGLGGASVDRIVFTAKPIGEVAVQQ